MIDFDTGLNYSTNFSMQCFFYVDILCNSYGRPWGAGTPELVAMELLTIFLIV
jgi:hypothetical protein